ncbi:hypothetical protein J7L01_07915 [bacterium]|nr:hypothetical protein [bacterium]
MEEGEIRRLVLKALYELGVDDYGGEEILVKILKLEPRLTKKDLLNENSEYGNSPILKAIVYLHDKKLIEYNPIEEIGFPVEEFYARINAYGIDVIDDPNKITDEIPVVHQNINVSGGQAAVSGVGDATFNINNIN